MTGLSPRVTGGLAPRTTTSNSSQLRPVSITDMNATALEATS